MATCKQCGKKGFLLTVNENGLCKKCELKKLVIQNTSPKSESEWQAEVKHTDDLIELVNKARSKYKEDGNLEDALKAYEYALIDSEPPLLNAQSHSLFLIQLYKKAGLRDKAWGFLNSTGMDVMKYGRERLPREKVYEEQAKIVKEEKRFGYAIEFLLMSYFERGMYTEDKFDKEVLPLIKKLGWPDSTKGDLMSILDSELTKGDINGAGEIRKTYRDYVSSHNLNQK